jgi:tRNA-2-methylthio-N6-dimethylallyladenosine synthase
MSAPAQKKLYIKTWGCQMNVYDSNRMADILSPFGYGLVDEPSDADMVILNTCHIREKATDKVFSDIGRLEKHKAAKEAKGEKMIIAVSGCVAQAEGDLILDRAKSVDLVFGPQTYHELPEMLVRAGAERIVNTELAVEEKFDSLTHDRTNTGPAAFLSVQEGCDKFCTFCVVPYTRGAEFSRPVAQVMDEAKRLADAGVREVTLLGQNVNAYHGDATGGTWGLARLIEEIAQINGVERIRYMTSHPRDMDQDLIDAHRDIPQLMPYLHLPVQSGSDGVLKAMNRKHTAAHYIDIIERVRAARPDIALSGDFIVGFPGETDAHFEETLQFVSEINYASAYSFKYSPRPGTPAANMQGLVREDVKSERLQRLQDLLFAQQNAFNAAKVGQTLPVLIEKKGNRAGQLMGKSPYNQSVYIEGNDRLIGQVIDINIENSSASALTGSVKTVETIAA